MVAVKSVFFCQVLSVLSKPARDLLSQIQISDLFYFKNRNRNLYLNVLASCGLFDISWLLENVE